MKKITYVFSCLALLLTIALPVSAQTVAVGVSPATYQLTMHEGQVAELDFGLSRNETMGDFSFEVILEQETELAQLSGPEVVILNGENTAQYSVTLNSSGIATGEHEVTVNFRDNNQKEGGEVLSIRYGLQSKIIANVVSQAAYDSALATSGIEVNNVHVPKNNGSMNEPLAVKFDLSNPGNIFVDSLEYRVDIKDDAGIVVQSQSKTATVDLGPYESTPIVEAISVDKIGDYAIEIFVGGEEMPLGENFGSFSITEKQQSLELSAVDYIIIAVGGLCILLGLRLFIKRR